MSVLLIIEIFVLSGKTFVSSTSFFMFIFPRNSRYFFINKVIFSTKVAGHAQTQNFQVENIWKFAKPNRDYTCTERRNYIDLTAVLKLLALNRSKRGSVRSSLRVAMETNLALFSWDSFHQCLFLFTLNKSFEKLFSVITLKHHLC